MKTIILMIVALAIIIGGTYFFTNSSIFSPESPANEDVSVVPSTNITPSDTTDTEEPIDTDTEPEDKTKTVIGSSVGEHELTAYHYGTGEKEVLFVGGIHGGYSWNTVLVAYELMDYLSENPDVIPQDVKVTVIPVLNPDGLTKVVGSTDRFTKADVPTAKDATIPGRFNGNNVDLNRNFDCDWQASGTWQNRTVSGGSKVFSEPETQALRDYVTSHDIAGAVVWYSSAGGVYSSNCHNGVLPETKTLTSIYAKASGYPAYDEFNYYEITGDAVNWLASQSIPAISVLLTTHEDTEWTKNKAGVEALIAHFSE